MVEHVSRLVGIRETPEEKGEVLKPVNNEGMDVDKVVGINVHLFF